MKKFKITIENTKERLDKFLAGQVTDITRSQIQKLVKQGAVFVNGQRSSAHYNLKLGDQVEINEASFLKTAPNNSLGSSPLPRDCCQAGDSKFSQVEVVAETDEYLVLNKPANLVMHGADFVKEKTLADFLLEKYPKIKKIGEDPIRPGIVHRLDKEVSGLTVVAKYQDSFDSLKNQFQKRTINKEYTALVYGCVAKDENEILFPLKRSREGKMAALPITDRGEQNIDKLGARRAITEFQVIKRFINYTLLKVKIKTGRTHQIRVHLLAYGHPLVGDDLYSTKRSRERNKKINLGRIFLVSDKLSFRDLAGERQTFTLELPKELKEILKKIK